MAKIKPIDIEKVKVLYDNIIVKGIKGSEDVGGLVLPDTYENKPQLGEVIAHGEGRLLDTGETLEIAVEKGDIVLFNKYSTTTFQVRDEEYLVIREEDVICII